MQTLRHHNMSRAIQLLVAAPLLCAGSALGATFGGFSTTPGTPVTVTALSQASNATDLGTLTATVQFGSGGTITLPFVSISATAVRASHPDFTITLTGGTGNLTTCDIRAVSSACNVYAVAIGLGGGRSAFDLALPNPGTAGSSTGRNPTPVTMTGAWTAYVGFENQIQRLSDPIQGDTYQMMHVKFVNNFDANDRFVFRIDTDKIG